MASGPNRSARGVELVKSQNSTVTCLRSPSRALREVRIFSARCLGVYATGAVGGDETVSSVSTGCPQARQNLAPAGSSVPHALHARVRRTPHARQNLACGGFSWWHWGHCSTGPPLTG